VAAVEQVITYKKELLAGETVSVFSSIVDVKERVLRFLHEMRKGETDEIAATTLQTTVHIDAVTRKAVALPADVAAKARGFTTSP
jgi:acyl-CoA thioester hydrolase